MSTESAEDVEFAARQELARALTDETALTEAMLAGNAPPPRGSFAILGGLGLPSWTGWHSAVFVLHDDAEPPESSLPYRATLTLHPIPGAVGGRWHLDSIESACASCFGFGIIESKMEPCATCQATGWGPRASGPQLVIHDASGKILKVEALAIPAPGR